MPQITWLKLGLTFGLLLLIFGAGFELRVLIDHSNERAALIEATKAQAAAQAKADAAAADWEKQLQTLRTANKKLTRRLRNETQSAIYSTCVVPSGGVQLYNDAIGQAAGGSDGVVSVP